MINAMKGLNIPFFLKNWGCTRISAKDLNAILQRNNKLLAAQKKLENELINITNSNSPQAE